jgi:multiple sugar transport system substrate-binding protein
MSLKRLRRAYTLFQLGWVFLLAACQTGGGLSSGTKTPTVDQVGAAVTARPKATPTAVFTPTVEIPAELNVSPADLKNVEIRFLHPLTGAAAEKLESQVRLFNFNNEWDIRVSLEPTDSTVALEDAVRNAAEGILPDVVLAPPDLLAAWDQENNLLADLSIYLDDETWGLAKAERTGYDERFWNQDRIGDKQIGLPALRTALGLIYNRTFAADLGYKTPPGTQEDFLTQACASAKDNNRFFPRYGTGGWMLDTRPLSALSWLTAFGAQVEPTGTDPAWHFNQSESKDALAFLHEMQSKGCVWIPKYPTPYTYFSGRQAFLYTATLQDLVPQQGAMTVANNQDQWGFIPFPAKEGSAIVYAPGFSYAILQSSERMSPAQQMAAWMFIRWMSSKTQLVDLAEAWPSLPVRADVRAELETKKNSFPWTMILPLMENVRPAPAQASWRVVRRPLEDAFWQTFNLASEEQLNSILPTLDAMAADLQKGP